ncbi:MAG: ATP-binding protein, partial [Candidatus Cryptobacteroides sp.]
GYAFEDVCFNHIPQIKEALGIAGIITEEGTLLIRNEGKTNSGGLQLDMLIWRSDNVVNLCEMKYTKEPYAIDEKYSEKLISRAEKFSAIYSKSIPHITLISPKGVKFNKYSSAVQSIVSSNEIFK